MKIIVLVGSGSGEEEVSMATGMAVQSALQRLNHDVILLQFDEHFVTKVHSIKPDLVFNAMHGKYGEDGTVPAILEMMQISYTHSGVAASALGMNKALSRRIFSDCDIPVPPCLIVEASAIISGAYVEQIMSFNWKKAVLKPVDSGSSLGVILLTMQDKKDGDMAPEDLSIKDILATGYSTFHELHGKFLIEEYIPGRELNVCIVGDKVLGGVVEIVFDGDIFNYKAKYDPNMSKHDMKPDIPYVMQQRILDLAILAHKVLDCKAVSRVEFRLDDSMPGRERLVMLEINTHPGLSPASILPDVAQQNGVSFDDVVSIILREANYFK